MRIGAESVELELVAVPPGGFRMGSGHELFSEAPVREVNLRPGFLLGRFAVTQAQWRAVMGDDPSAPGGTSDHPVDGVSWDRADEFCRRLGDESGRRVRLPSEAEWEYACRGGTTGEFFFGPWGPFRDEGGISREARDALGDHAWFDENSGGRSRASGLKRPNPWGLHDMLGNVWEWCSDVWHGDYVDAPRDGSPWTEGEGRQPRRCQRGGAWDMDAFRCRSTYRSFDHATVATDRSGFRVAVDA